MSTQFGICTFDGQPLDPEFLLTVSKLVASFGSDSANHYSDEGVSILYHAFHTTKESRAERQPHRTPTGPVLTWDGRLDNRDELIRSLPELRSTGAPDVSIVAAAYERWGSDCFAKLVGDWALSIWNANDRSLILAKDPIGARQLCYAIEPNHVVWSTVLDPIVLLSGHNWQLDEEYLAGCLAHFPRVERTPYVGIHAVPPASFILLRSRTTQVREYWHFDAKKRFHYRTDAEYEEHFRSVFATSIERRLRSDSPVIAELSGGMDSASIVSMADRIIAQRDGGTALLDTLSYYDDSEPSWNERPYFTKVEEKRGRVGYHVPLSWDEAFQVDLEDDRFRATPATPVGTRNQESAHGWPREYRVILSGIGGDEVLGGVPTPLPELRDLLARGRMRTLAHQLKVWAIEKRMPWFHLLASAIRGFLPRSATKAPVYKRPAPWLNSGFVKRHQDAFCAYETRIKLSGALPTFQENIATLDELRRQLAIIPLPQGSNQEKRYPYLDRDLLEFLYAIPRSQVLRPGQRRSLMRRALVGIVPDEVLNRKRKAFASRAPMAAISSAWPEILAITETMVMESMGIICHKAFLNALENARQGREVPMVPILRTIGVEMWIRNLSRQGVLDHRDAAEDIRRLSPLRKGMQAILPKFHASQA